MEPGGRTVSVTDSLATAVLDAFDRDPDALERLRDLVDARSGHEAWVCVREAAAYLNCHRQRIYNLLSERAIPHRKDGSRLLFRLSELDDWLAG